MVNLKASTLSDRTLSSVRERGENIRGEGGLQPGSGTLTEVRARVGTPPVVL